MELTKRQLGFMRWLALAPGRQAQVSHSWTQTTADLESAGLIETLGNHGVVLASLSPAGVAYLTALDDRVSDDRGREAEAHG
jgi:hypothetical protein